MKVCKCQKFWDLILKTVTLVKFFEIKKYPEILKENVWEFVWVRVKLQYIQFLKTLPVSQFSILNPQIFGDYYLSPALSISDAYRVLISGF